MNIWYQSRLYLRIHPHDFNYLRKFLEVSLNTKDLHWKTVIKNLEQSELYDADSTRNVAHHEEYFTTIDIAQSALIY